MEEIQKCLLGLSESVASRLRKAHVQACMVSVEIKYSSFQTASHQATLPDATSDSGCIYRTACRLAAELWNGSPVRLLGIRTSKLEDMDEINKEFVEVWNSENVDALQAFNEKLNVLAEMYRI